MTNQYQKLMGPQVSGGKVTTGGINGSGAISGGSVSQPTVEKDYKPKYVKGGQEVKPAPGSAGKGQMGGPADGYESGHNV